MSLWLINLHIDETTKKLEIGVGCEFDRGIINGE